MSDHDLHTEEPLARLLAPAAPGEWAPPPGLAAAVSSQAGGGGMVALALGEEAMRSATRAVFALAVAVVVGTAGLACLTPPPHAEPPAWLHSDVVRLAATPATAGDHA